MRGGLPAHKIKPPERAIACIWQALKPGGRFAAEFGGKGNVEAILNAISSVLAESGYRVSPEFNPWYFPSIGEYATLLEQQGFEVSYATLFDRLTSLEGNEKGMRNWIDMFGKNILEVIPASEQAKIIERIEQKLSSQLYQNDTWFVDYRRIRVIAKKKPSLEY